MLQYALRTLLLWMLAASLATWVLFVLPDPAGVLVLGGILAIIPGLIVAGIVYFSGHRQAFCIGAAPVQLALLMTGTFWFYVPRFINPFQYPSNFPWDEETCLVMKFYMLTSLGLMVAAGGGAIWIRYLALPREDSVRRKHSVMVPSPTVVTPQATNDK